MIGAGACQPRYIYLPCEPADQCDLDARDGGGGAGGAMPPVASTLLAGSAFSCATFKNALYCWGSPPAPLDGVDATDPGAPSRAAPVHGLASAVAAGGGGTLCAIQE